jgi:hypothetical protein
MHNPRFANSCMDGVVVLWGKKLERNDEFAPIRVSVFALTEER